MRNVYCDRVVAATFDRLLADPQASQQTRGPRLIGISGVPGSGKSTFAHQLASLASARGISTEVLALDDFYHGRRARAQLARDVHPLLATRGVPGTHEIKFLLRTLRQLEHASLRRPAIVSRFDKGRDTRLPPARWRRVTAPPELILLEGWCVGVAAQSEAALVYPINALERDEDGDGRWRRWVNRQLAGRYALVWNQLDALILLEAPTLSVVPQWRSEQERALQRRNAPLAMNAIVLARFLQHYERLIHHSLRTLPAQASIRILLRKDRSVRSIAATVAPTRSAVRA